MPVLRRLVQRCYSLETSEIVMTEATAESVDSIIIIIRVEVGWEVGRE